MHSSNRLALTGALVLAVLASFVAVAPQAFAHQRQLYTIGDKDYLIVIGSKNEPVFVDDKSGVDLFVYSPDPSDPMNSRAAGTKPVEGLEKTLKVELSAGDKKMTLPLEPAHRDPGHYNAPFYPTVATTYNYRIFGTINNTPVNLTFTCSAGGEGATANNSTVVISAGVVRKGLAGGFGCPKAITDAGFPEKYTSNVDMNAALKQLQSDVSSIKSSVSSPSTSNDGTMMAFAGIGAGVVGIGLAIGAIVIASKKKG